MTVTLKASIAGALALTLAAGAAFAQPAQGGGRGAFRQACGADIQKFCPNMGPGSGEMRACVRKNFDSLSDACKAAIQQMRSRRQQQGGEGGGAAPQ